MHATRARRRHRGAGRSYGTDMATLFGDEGASACRNLQSRQDTTERRRKVQIRQLFARNGSREHMMQRSISIVGALSLFLLSPSLSPATQEATVTEQSKVSPNATMDAITRASELQWDGKYLAAL